MAIIDSIQANKGLCLVSSMITLFQLTSVYFLSSALTWKILWDYFFGFNDMSTVFQMYKGDISWNCTSHVICLG